MLSRAQARLKPMGPLLKDLYNTLNTGEADRERERTPRWQAGYDLAMGQVLAAIVRADIYDSLLKEVTGKQFKDPRSNTWVLVPTNETTLQGQRSEFAAESKKYLQRVIEEHPDTPWALLAKYELQRPYGWEWGEDFTDLTPRRGMGAGDGGGGGGLGGGRGPGAAAKRSVPKL